MKSTKLIKRFLPYYRKYINILILDLSCAVLTILCEIFFPLIIRYITDLATTNLAKLTWQVVLVGGAIYLGLRIVDTLANYFMQSVGHVMGAKIETDMRSDLFSHLTCLSFGYYSNAKIGTLMSRLTNDLFDVTEFSHHCPEEMFIAALKIVVSFGILASFNIYLTLIIFGLMPFMFIFTQYFNKKMRKAFKEQRKTLGEINAQAEDSLLGIRVVKSFANETIEQEKFQQNNEVFLKTKTEGYKHMAGFHSVTRIFDGIMYLAVIVAGALFLIYGKITIGEFSAFLLYVTTLLSSIRRIVEYKEQFTRGITGIERFVEILDTPKENLKDSSAIEIKIVEGKIELKNVSFSYQDNNSEVIRHLNLNVNAGEHLAIVGTSGGGKTTLCNLIPRFYELSEGQIIIDGVDIKNATLTSLRENIGIVQQDTYLFSGSIAENIAYGKNGCTREEIIEAAKHAGAHEFIMSFPKAYDTYVGERGVKLSGGQKQRISIARVFLKSPKILILDEATSALDNESEQLIKHSLELLSKGRTTITIAHRLTTIRNADRIIVINNGEIIEQGTHDELMNIKGFYHKLNI